MGAPLQNDVGVNGVTIPVARIAAEAQLHPAPPGKPGLAWRAAARALAVRELLLQEADRLGVDARPRDLGAGKRETDEEALIRAVIEARLRPEPPGEAACRAFLAAHADRFRAPNLYEASHILLAARPGSPARATACEAAVVLLTELAASPDAFDRLARTHSDCPSGATGGRLGQIVEGDTVPEFEAVLATLAVETISPDPVETRYGVHIVRLDARAVGAPLTFEAARPRIREILERRAWARCAKALTEELIGAAQITGVDWPRSRAAVGS
jgi:peptidyl-prolyl cis-trans isomerase C